MIQTNAKRNKQHYAKDGVVGDGEGQVERHLVCLTYKKIGMLHKYKNVLRQVMQLLSFDNM